MASRYPPGQNSSRFHRPAHTHSTHPSKSNYTPAPRSTPPCTSSNRHSSPRSFIRSPPPPAPEMYLASMIFSNSSLTAERDPPPDCTHAGSSTYSHRSRGNNDSSPRYQQASDSYRGRRKSPRGRKATPPRSEFRPEPRAPYHSEKSYYRSYTNEQSWSGPSHQEDRGAFPYSPTYKSSSNSSRGPTSTQTSPLISNSGNGGTFNAFRNKHNKSSKPFKRDSERPLQQPPAKKQEQILKTEATSKDQCPICLNEVKDKVSLKCDHGFCYECLVKWCATKETCPLCRSKITELKEMNKSLPNQRMIASFICVCGNKWKSGYAYNGIKQGCKVCQRDVAASEQHPQNRTPTQINSFLGLFPLLREKESSHKQELCGMCKLMGRDCSRQDTLGDDDDLLDLVGLENLMALFNLSESSVDHVIGERDWSNPFSDPDDLDVADLGFEDLYEPIYDYNLYDGDYDVDEIYEIDWEPDCWDD